MRVTDLDYELPPELIAQTPLPHRDQSRLLVLERSSRRLTHRRFYEIVDYFRPGDLLVANDTRVHPGRLQGFKAETGGRVELLLLREEAPDVWAALVRGRRVRPGGRVRLGQGEVAAEFLERRGQGEWVVRFDPPGLLRTRLPKIGEMPLPPYIKQPLAEPERYQTVYATAEGSAAAPTAGLHFTPAVLEKLRERGVSLAFITLHIGLDTFRPIQTEQVEDHPMHTEYYEISPETAQAVRDTQAGGGRIVAVGTTTVRTLESAAQSGPVQPGGRWTSLFITPGYSFRVVEALLTNFHRPRTTLLALVAAFAGLDLIREAYREAIAQRYRLLSFGDAMLIL